MDIVRLEMRRVSSVEHGQTNGSLKSPEDSHLDFHARYLDILGEFQSLENSCPAA